MHDQPPLANINDQLSQRTALRIECVVRENSSSNLAASIFVAMIALPA
jgi:hypothetical protein